MLSSAMQSPPLLRAFRGRFRPLVLLTAALAGCGSPVEPVPDGQGLVILPDDGPLARGVERRDPRLNFHDFGTVSDGDTVAHVFRLRNTDPRPVAITRVDPGCGCTVAALRVVRLDGTVEKGEPIRSKAPELLSVGPGELAEVEVQIATRDLTTKNNHKLITLRILTDSPNGYFISLEVHVFVEQPFALVPGTLALGLVPESGGGQGKIEIVPAGHFAHELKEILPPPEGVAAELTREERLGVTLWTLQARLEPPLARGPRNLELRISTEEQPGVPGRDVVVPLTATVVDDLLAQPQRLVFAARGDGVHRGESELYSLLSGHRLRVTGVELPAEQRGVLAARFEPLDPDDGGSSLRWRITLEARPPFPAQDMLTGTLLVRLADPQHPRHELEYVVHLR
jgi:hypothetical protein